MNIEQTISELSSLPVVQRLQIIRTLWDSIPAEAEIPVSPEQQAELNRRVAARRANPESAISGDEIEKNLRDRH